MADEGPDMEFVYAQLRDKFRYTTTTIAEMTDREIWGQCFYPRNDKGELRQRGTLFESTTTGVLFSGNEADQEPGPPMTLAEERVILFSIGAKLGIGQADLEAAWKAKHGEEQDRRHESS